MLNSHDNILSILSENLRALCGLCGELCFRNYDPEYQWRGEIYGTPRNALRTPSARSMSASLLWR